MRCLRRFEVEVGGLEFLIPGRPSVSRRSDVDLDADCCFILDSVLWAQTLYVIYHDQNLSRGMELLLP